MNLTKEKLLNRIDRALGENTNQLGFVSDNVASLHLETTSIIEIIYGSNSTQFAAMENACRQIYDDDSELVTLNSKHSNFSYQLTNILTALKANIEAGLIDEIESTARSEVLNDFLELASEQQAENQKNIAAVLACAALEDALKRTAKQHGLDVDGRNMSDVINALKSESIIRSSQAEVLHAYRKIRNDTFHGAWDAVDDNDVRNIIAYTKTFLREQATNAPR